MIKKSLSTKETKSVNFSEGLISPLYLQGLGNFKYIALARNVKSTGIVIEPNKWAIKLYSLLIEGEKHPNNEELIEKTRLIIEHKYKRQEVAFHTGFGFAIISPGFINISTWGGEYPSILNPHVFTFPENKKFINIRPSQLKKEDIDKVGAYCVWELGITQHEASAWREYLFKNNDDAESSLHQKIKYLKNIFQGRIGAQQS